MKYTYKESYDKIIDAYFKDEIQPFSHSFCFCGTLSPDHYWHRNSGRLPDERYPYSQYEYMKMERALMIAIGSYVIDPKLPGSWLVIDYTEDQLFAGMTAALEVLKKIHKCRGDEVEELPKLTNRVLCDSINY